MKISLICATYNRLTELEHLLESLVVQTYKNFEIIIVDQNGNGLIDQLCLVYKNKLDLKHLKSKQLGLSISRNFGITKACGDILAFPDDDCTYYPDTLENVLNYFYTHQNTNLVYGRIYDRQLKKNIMRNWLLSSLVIKNLKQVMLFTCSITIFIKNNKIMFDEKFGVNQEFGGGEDIELCYRCFKNGQSLEYTPLIEVNHPDVASNFLNPHKAYNYGRGWGAFFAKHCNLKNFPSFIGILGYVALLALRDVIFFKPTAKGRVYSILGRISGFFNYLLDCRK